MKKKLLTVEELMAAAPGPIVSYDQAVILSGGLVSKKSLQNYASLGEMPPKIRLGKRVGFKTGDFARWLVARIENSSKDA